MSKIYILDTSTIVYHPFCFKSFKKNTVIIPIPVLEELDKLKSYADETGKNARTFMRTIDQIIKGSKEGIHNGIKIEDDVILKIDTNLVHNDTLGSPLYGDNRILSYTLQAQKATKTKKVILVSKDIGLRVRANSYGIAAEDYIRDNYSLNDLPPAHKAIEITDDEVNDFYKNGMLELPDALIKDLQLKSNNFVTLQDYSGNEVGLARYNSQTKMVKSLNRTKSLFGIHAKNLEQQFAIDLLLDNDVKLVVLSGPSGTGKAQPLDAKVLTPNGWVTMGDIAAGDFVIGSDGLSKKVLKVFPQGQKNIVRVDFSDNSSTECCEDHLWETSDNKERYRKYNKSSVKVTKDIAKSIKDSHNRNNHSIPMVKPVQFNQQEVPIDPYLLGVLLGDGGLTGTCPTLSTSDMEILHLCQEVLPQGVSFKKHKNSKYDYYITKSRRTGGIDNKINPLTAKLANLHLMNQRSDTKFIPDIYKFNSVNVRLGVFQGLMDTDGFCSEDGAYLCYYSTSISLIRDMQFIVQSFGGKATISTKQSQYTYNNIKKLGKKSYILNISLPNDIVPFRLGRKLDRVKPKTKYLPKRFITNISYVGKKESKCILIDSEDHLYVTDNFILTHNTLLTIAAGLYNLMERADKKYEKLIIMKPIVSVGKDLGILPGTKEEKLSPYLASYYDNINFLMKNSKTGKGNHKSNSMDPYLSLMMENGTIEIEAISYLRGRSLPNAFIIIDEIQNSSMHELKTILTRIGEGSKIVLIGDESQIDNMSLSVGSNALITAISKFADYQIAGNVCLTKGERSELATLAAKVL